jgi:hypothetical protein
MPFLVHFCFLISPNPKQSTSWMEAIKTKFVFKTDRQLKTFICCYLSMQKSEKDCIDRGTLIRSFFLK